MTTSNEHNNAPAVPQGDPTEEMLVAGLKECEPLGELIDWREGFGRIEMRAVWEAMLAATPAPAPAQGEPFGYFRAEPFGWTDCSEDAEGAIALYEHPAKPAQEVGLTDEEIEAIAKKHMSTVGDHWCNEEAIREIHAEDFARDIIAALRAKGRK